MKCLILTVVLVSVVAAEKQVCEPRKTFSDYCNTCTCSEDGLSAVCTSMSCDKDIWNQDGTTKIMFKSADDQVYKAESRLVGQCPDCTCTCSCS